MKTIVITGADGFIGRSLTEFLKNKYNIVGFDNKLTRAKEYSNGLHFPWSFNQSSSFRMIEKLYNDNELAGIVHLGACSTLSQSIKNPLKYWDNNVGATIDLVRFLIESKIDVPFVNASSASVYGGDVNSRWSLREYDERYPKSPYAKTKSTVEVFLEDQADYLLFNSVSLRFFNVVGALGAGFQRIDQPHIAPSILCAMINETPFELRGKDTVRDYVDVEYVCSVILNCIEKFPKDGHTVFNVGSGVGVSNNMFVEQFLDTWQQLWVSPKPPRITTTFSGEYEPTYLIADTKKLTKFMGSEYVMSFEKTMFNIVSTYGEVYL